MAAQPGDPDFVGPIRRPPPQPGDPGFVGPVKPKPAQPGSPQFVGPPAPIKPKPGDYSFVGPVRGPTKPPTPTEQQIIEQEKQLQETITSLEDKPVVVEYKTPSGEIKTVQTTGFKKGFQLHGDIVSVSPLLPGGGRGRAVLVSHGPGFYETTQKEYRAGGKIPTWYRQDITVPEEIKFLGYEQEYLRYGYETSIGITKADDIAFNKELEKHFERLTTSKQFEYGLRFGEIGKQPLQEWKYYKGGTEYITKLPGPERLKLIEEYVSKHPELYSAGRKAEVGVTQALSYTPILGVPALIGSLFGIKETERAFRKVETPSGIRQAAWEEMTFTPTEIKQQQYARLNIFQRAIHSTTHAFGTAVLFPVTLPQMGYKFVTGKKSLGVLDVGEQLGKVKLGPGGLVGPAIGEVWLGQDVRVEKELQKKYPVETGFATVGEIFGIYVGGKGISMGYKAVKPQFISTVRTIGTKLYTQVPKGWGKAFPKLQPLRTYIYGKPPTYTNIIKTVGHDISKTVPGRAITVTPRTVTQPVFTATGRVKQIVSTVKSPFVGKQMGTIMKFKPVATRLQESITKTGQQFVKQWSLPTRPFIPTRYNIFQLAKTGFKRFTGMERAIGKPLLVSGEVTVKGYGGASQQKHGFFYKTEQYFRKGWGKKYIPEEEFLKMGKPVFKPRTGIDYYRPDGKGIVPKYIQHGKYVKELKFIGESRSDIISSIQKTIKTPGTRITGGPTKSFIESRTSGGWLYRPPGTPRRLIFGERFKHFIGEKGSLHISEDITKGVRIPQSLTLKTDVVTRIKTRFGTEYGGMPKYPKPKPFPKPDAFKKTPFPKRSGWGRQVTLQEVEAMEEGIGTSVHSFWKGVTPSKPFYPTTLGADIAAGLVIGGVYGVGFISLPKIKTIQEPRFKPDIKVDTFKIDIVQPRSDIVFKPKVGVDVFDRSLYTPVQANIVDTTPKQVNIQFQEQLQRQQQKYMPYQPAPTISQQVYKYKLPKVLFIPPLPETKKKKGKRKLIELFGKGYRYRKWKVPRMEDIIGGI